MSCRVDRAANKVTLARQAEALKKLCGPQDQGSVSWLRNVLLGSDEQEAGMGIEQFLCAQERGAGDELPTKSPLLEHCNPSQVSAMAASLKRQMTLIQGPPGAGKTSTALLLVKFLLAAGRGPVLCTAESNIAVDNLLRGCAQSDITVVR